VSKVLRKPAPLQRKPPSNQPAAKLRPDSLLAVGICAGLILGIFIVYAQVGHFDFTNFDDPDYVYENVHVQAGLTAASVKWALTAEVVGNWMPVTLLSHILDDQLFGMDSGMHHLVNVLLHMLSSLLLFAVLRRATGALGASAFVAFAFALHPLHVESVAWVAERKDVLSGFFFFLALYAYVRYAESPNWRRYLMVAALFCLGLMSKPMLVTFPFTLLLLDFWPLRRAQFPKTLWEKLPLMALSAGASVVTYFAQTAAISVYPLTRRMENALISYVAYIWQMFWPSRMAVFYPYADSVPVWQPACALAVLLAISALAVFTWRTRPYILTGWLWYLGTLVPVIGLVQVGGQSRADRYTYIPMVGLLWILGWGAADVARNWPRAKPAIAAAAVFSCAACMALSWRQASYWENGATLFQHAVDVTDDNLWARYNLSLCQYLLGSRLMDSGHAAAAIDHLEEALRVRPNYADAHNELGVLFSRMQGHSADAISHFEAAVNLDPKIMQAHRNLGMMLASVAGRESEAIAQLEIAQRMQPDPEVLQTLNRLRGKSGLH